MKVSIPSLSQILESIYSTFKRFPIVLSVAFLGTVGTILLVEISDTLSVQFSVNLRIFVICLLGISVSFAVDIYSERSGFNVARQNLLRTSVLILLAAYYFLIGDGFAQGPHQVWFRYILFVLAAHLAVAFAPYTGKGNIDQFWEYNKALFLRILLSALYSAALFIGLVIALLAIDNLLGISIKGERYLQLFIFQVGMFNTFFFLSGVPKIGPDSRLELKYPNGLKLFVQYVLIPLVTIYILILYMYLVKIVLQWELPDGWVSNLVLSFSIAGILSLLLLYPIRNDADHKWISVYSRGYYFALIPLVILLMVSIGTRISEYGVTVPRYFVATLGVWLSGIVLYFLISKAKSIKMIPITLCVIALVTSFGPLGAFAVSERSQLGRFEELAQRNGVLNEDGMIKTAEVKLEFSDRKELSSVVDYIVETHGVEILQSYFQKDFSNKDEPVKTAHDVMDLMGLDFVSSWQTSETLYDREWFRFITLDIMKAELQGYDISIGNVRFNTTVDHSQFAEEGENIWEFRLFVSDGELLVREKNTGKAITFDLKEIVDDIEAGTEEKEGQQYIPGDNMTFVRENDQLKVKIQFESIEGNNKEGFSIKGLTFNSIIKIK